MRELVLQSDYRVELTLMPQGSTEASLAETLRPSQHPSLSSQDRQGKHSAFHLERDYVSSAFARWRGLLITPTHNTSSAPLVHVPKAPEIKYEL